MSLWLIRHLIININSPCPQASSLTVAAVQTKPRYFPIKSLIKKIVLLRSVSVKRQQCRLTWVQGMITFSKIQEIQMRTQIHTAFHKIKCYPLIVNRAQLQHQRTLVDLRLISWATRSWTKIVICILLFNKMLRFKIGTKVLFLLIIVKETVISILEVLLGLRAWLQTHLQMEIVDSKHIDQAAQK
jgi:hypothetical protein